MKLSPEETILKRLDDIERRLAAVERDALPLKRFGGAPTFEWPQTCPKCGIKLNTAMAYCCPDSNCPTGLGPIMCQVQK